MIKLEIRDVYKEFILEQHSKYQILYGGAGSGKSYAVAQKLIYRLLSVDNYTMLVIRKRYNSLKNSCYTLINTILQRGDISYDTKVSPLEFYYKPTNSKILFYGLDDVNKLKSLTDIHLIWIEEADQISKTDFEQLRTRLRGKSSLTNQILISFNPVSRENWLYNTFFNPLTTTTDVKNNSYILKTTYKDNIPNLPPEYISTLESFKDSNKFFYDVYVNGEWGSIGKLVFNNYGIEKFIDKEGETIYGIDFGYNNPTAIVQITNYDNRFYIKELLYQSGLTTSELIKKLPNLIHSKKSYIYCDSAEPKTIEELRIAGYNAVSSDKDVLSGIKWIQSNINKIILDKNSINLLEEFSQYQYKETRDGKILEEPVKFRDHLVDATRYAIYTHYKQYIKTNWSKKIFI